MDVILAMNHEQVVIPIDESNEFVIDVDVPSTPIRQPRVKVCPNAPVKENNYNFYQNEFDREIEELYKKAEATAAIQIDDGYFPIGAKCLIGRKIYKTFSADRGLIPMKALLLLIKTEYGWMRTNVHMELNDSDSNEWDVEFIGL